MYMHQFDCCSAYSLSEWGLTPFGLGQSSEPGFQDMNQNSFDTLPDTCCSDAFYCSVNSLVVRREVSIKLRSFVHFIDF